MTDSPSPAPGSIAWHDLTVENAAEVGDFYQQVVGWSSEPVDMDGYADFNMVEPGTGQPAAGVCHARGSNAEIPAQWLMYVVVADLDQSMARCREMGGKVVSGPRAVGKARFCVIRDPAGASMALYQTEA